MADFFSNLKEKLSEKAEVIAKKTEEVADVVAKKTEQTIDVQKIKNQIRTMERNNERDLLDIGKMILSCCCMNLPQVMRGLLSAG